MNLQEEKLDTSMIKNEDMHFDFDKGILDTNLDIYVKKLKELAS